MPNQEEQSAIDLSSFIEDDEPTDMPEEGLNTKINRHETQLDKPDETIIQFENMVPSVQEFLERTIGEEEAAKVSMPNYQYENTIRAIKKRKSPHVVNSVMICNPELCPRINSCPYAISNTIAKVISKECPIEMDMVEKMYSKYLKAVAERLQGDIKDLDIVEENMIEELVVQELIKDRAHSSIAYKGMLTEQAVRGNEGEVEYNEIERPEFNISNRASKRQDQIIRQLVASPEMQERIKKNRQEIDPSTRASIQMDMAMAVLDAYEEGKKEGDVTTAIERMRLRMLPNSRRKMSIISEEENEEVENDKQTPSTDD